MATVAELFVALPGDSVAPVVRIDADIIFVEVDAIRDVSVEARTPVVRTPNVVGVELWWLYITLRCGCGVGGGGSGSGRPEAEMVLKWFHERAIDVTTGTRKTIVHGDTTDMATRVTCPDICKHMSG